ncbi:hypothetical protein CDAR_449161 [Caerostris darwini]|uniref:Uncharacterized protein n=1 Tax=Caerostris darwini TaxID=1538125 RepID=A0AAV4QV02_9ARAC|nr:hypothetical protein CDAR_449161 [Caerostris darwini]
MKLLDFMGLKKRLFLPAKSNVCWGALPKGIKRMWCTPSRHSTTIVRSSASRSTKLHTTSRKVFQGFQNLQQMKGFPLIWVILVLV